MSRAREKVEYISEAYVDDVDMIHVLIQHVNDLEARVFELESKDEVEEPVHASALCEADWCRDCGACEDYRQNGGRI